MIAATIYGMESSDNLEGLNPVYRIIAKYAFGNKLFTNFLAFAVSHGVFQAVSHKVSMACLNTWDYTWNKTIGEMWAHFQLKRDIKSAIKGWEIDASKPVKHIPILPEKLTDYKALFVDPSLAKTNDGLIKPSHLLLYGKPGGGKTTFLNHLAYLAVKDKESTMLFKFPRATFDLIPEGFIGLALENYFAGCEEIAAANGKTAACIVIEELDLLIGKSRDPQKSTSRQQKGFVAFLGQMEKLQATKRPISIAATTNSETLDEALQDRFHYKVPMDKPSFEEGITVFSQTIAEGQKDNTCLFVDWDKVAESYEVNSDVLQKYDRDQWVEKYCKRPNEKSKSCVIATAKDYYDGPLFLDHKLGYRRWTMIADNVLSRSKIKLLRAPDKKYFDCTNLVKEEIDAEIQRQLKEKNNTYPALIVNQNRSLTVVNPTLATIGSSALVPSNNNNRFQSGKMEQVEQVE